jgi:SAM-dependent methyltransferase
LQLGWPALQGLRCNRMPRRWLAAQEADLTCESPSCQVPPQARLVCHPEALPFAEASLDLLVLPHTLERCQSPHAALREVARVLVPEGRVLIFGLNRWSLWGAQHGLERPAQLNAARALSYWRLRDWLQLLALEVVAVDFGCHAPALDTALWQRRWGWLDSVGQRVWPVLGGAYCVLAVKKVQGVHLLGSTWRRQAVPAAAVAASAHKNKT